MYYLPTIVSVIGVHAGISLVTLTFCRKRFDVNENRRGRCGSSSLLFETLKMTTAARIAVTWISWFAAAATATDGASRTWHVAQTAHHYCRPTNRRRRRHRQRRQTAVTRRRRRSLADKSNFLLSQLLLLYHQAVTMYLWRSENLTHKKRRKFVAWKLQQI